MTLSALLASGPGPDAPGGAARRVSSYASASGPPALGLATSAQQLQRSATSSLAQAPRARDASHGGGDGSSPRSSGGRQALAASPSAHGGSSAAEASAQRPANARAGSRAGSRHMSRAVSRNSRMGRASVETSASQLGKLPPPAAAAAAAAAAVAAEAVGWADGGVASREGSLSSTMLSRWAPAWGSLLGL